MTFSNSTDILRYLKRVTYKPGYKFSCWVDEQYQGNIVLNLVIPVPDSTRADHKEVSIVYTDFLPIDAVLRYGETLLVEMLTKFFLGWERHEMDEWLRLDGKMYRDPHANDRGRR
jgi:hypothetical protein